MARKDANRGKKEQAAERHVRAFELRKTGASYRDIAYQLGVSVAQAHEDVQRVLGELHALALTGAQDYVNLELERLDAAQFALYQHLDSGDPQVINSWVRVSESRRKLLGLDAAPKVPLNPDGTPYQQAYIELRTFVLNYLPPEQRLLLAEQLAQVEDAIDGDEPDN